MYRANIITISLLVFLVGCTEPIVDKPTDPLEEAISRAMRTHRTEDWEKAHLMCYSAKSLRGVVQKLKEAERLRQKKYIQENKQLSESEKIAVLEGRYYIGMPKAALEASFGPPEEIIRHDFSREEWAYGFGLARRWFIFIEDKLVSVTDSGS